MESPSHPAYNLSYPPFMFKNLLFCTSLPLILLLNARRWDGCHVLSLVFISVVVQDLAGGIVLITPCQRRSRGHGATLPAGKEPGTPWYVPSGPHRVSARGGQCQEKQRRNGDPLVRSGRRQKARLPSPHNPLPLLILLITPLPLIFIFPFLHNSLHLLLSILFHLFFPSSSSSSSSVVGDKLDTRGNTLSERSDAAPLINIH